ncbi:MAG: radical SAM protein [Thermodesulfobacteriota bacterium]
MKSCKTLPFYPAMDKSFHHKKNPYVSRIESSRVPLWLNKRPLLTHLDMEITERCNLNCIHCYINQPAGDEAGRKKELATAAIKAILKDAADLGCLSIRFTGGEPLLREDFEELYIAARKLGMKVILFTNATLLTPRITALFTEIPPLAPIEITLYGMKKKSYETVTRTPGSFEAAWRGIDLVIARKLPFAVKSALLPPCLDEIGEFESWAAGVPTLSDAPSPVLLFNLRGRRDSARKNAAIRKLRLPPEKAVAILARDETAYIANTLAFCSRFTAPPDAGLFRCGAGKGGGAVSADGFFQPCLLLRHPDTLYDLKTGSFNEALTRFFPEARKIKAAHPDYLKRCAHCFLKGLCEQCPARSWMEHGTLDTPVDYLCEFAHAQARRLGLLKENEDAWAVPNWKVRIKGLAFRPGSR